MQQLELSNLQHRITIDHDRRIVTVRLAGTAATETIELSTVLREALAERGYSFRLFAAHEAIVRCAAPRIPVEPIHRISELL